MAFSREKMRENLTCTICLEIFREPKALPCQHIYCYECLDSYISKQNLFHLSRSIFRCPSCRESVELPEGGAASLPTSFYIKNMIEDLGIEEPVEKHCESCAENGKPGVKAVSFCEECKENLCEECVNAHARLKMTRDHKLVPLSPAPVKKKPPIPKKPAVTPQHGAEQGASALESDVADLKGKDAWLCKSHVESEISKYCVECRIPMCTNCLADIVSGKSKKHTKHRIEDIPNAATVAKKDLEEKLTEIEDACVEMEQGVDYLSHMQTSVEHSHETALHNIKEFGDQIKEVVDRWIENTSKRAEELKDEKCEEFVKQQKELQKQLKKIKTTEQKVRDKITDSDIGVLKQNQDLTNQIGNLKKNVTYKSDSLPPPINFSMSSEMNDRVGVALHSLLGDIKLGGSDLGPRRADSMSSLLSDHSLAEPDALKPRIETRIICSFSPIKGTMTGMCFTPDGQFFGVDNTLKCVKHYTLSGPKYHFTHRNDFGTGRLAEPIDVTQLPDRRVMVTDGKAGHSIKAFIPVRNAGNAPVTWEFNGNIAHATLDKATAITCAGPTHVLVTDVDKQAVYRFEVIVGDRFKIELDIKKHKDRKQFESPQFVCCSPQTGNFIVSDRDNSIIKMFSRDGKFRWRYGGWGTRGNQMKKPGGVCMDKLDRVYVADVLNQRIHVLAPNGKLIAHIPYKACARFNPAPDMLDITASGDLALANEKGMIKILKVDFM